MLRTLLNQRHLSRTHSENKLKKRSKTESPHEDPWIQNNMNIQDECASRSRNSVHTAIRNMMNTTKEQLGSGDGGD